MEQGDFMDGGARRRLVRFFTDQGQGLVVPVTASGHFAQDETLYVGEHLVGVVFVQEVLVADGGQRQCRAENADAKVEVAMLIGFGVRLRVGWLGTCWIRSMSGGQLDELALDAEGARVLWKALLEFFVVGAQLFADF